MDQREGLNKSGVYREWVEVDEDQAGGHDQVSHQREGSQVPQVADENQQNEERQEAEHVETGVEARHEDLGLVGVVHDAAEGGGVGCFYHLVMAEEKVKTWKCSYCTFVHEDTANNCKILICLNYSSLRRSVSM